MNKADADLLKQIQADRNKIREDIALVRHCKDCEQGLILGVKETQKFMCGITSVACCIFIFVQIIFTWAMYSAPEGEQFVYYNDELEKNCDAVKWEEETAYCIYDYCFEEEDCTEMKDWENSEA